MFYSVFFPCQKNNNNNNNKMNTKSVLIVTIGTYIINDNTRGWKKNLAWKYATMVNPENLSKFKCNFCGKEMNGGVYRVKQHLVGGYRNVIKCPKCLTEVSNEVADYVAKKKPLNDQLNLMPNFDEMVNEKDFEDEDDVVEISPHGKHPVPIQAFT
ncbi:hypothetical protein CsSME_00006478 [Camellia sinensis var. sinensis]